MNNTKFSQVKEEENLVTKIVSTNRVAKVVKGGRNFSFNATMVVGDKKGNVGVGFGKANEIINAIAKAKARAIKNMLKVPIIKGTIPHEIIAKFNSSKILLKPAAEGTGIIAGSSARAVLDVAGYENVLTKSLGSNSAINVVKATIKALSEIRTIRDVAKLRGKTVEEITGKGVKENNEIENNSN